MGYRLHVVYGKADGSESRDEACVQLPDSVPLPVAGEMFELDCSDTGGGIVRGKVLRRRFLYRDHDPMVPEDLHVILVLDMGARPRPAE